MRLPNGKKTDRILIRKPQNEYYENISLRFGIAQVVLYMGLLAFVVLSFLANTSLITYQNFYHFFKDLNSSFDDVDVVYSDTLVYPSAEEQSFTLYRNGLAVAGNSSVTVFTATGRQTVTVSLTYRNPIAVGHGKYLLVYDLGGTEYSLYNSYAQIHTGRTEYPITFATVSDEGTYVLVSASDQATSVAELYNDNFQRINRFSSQNGYYSAVTIDEEGELVALLSSSTDTTAFSTTLTVCRIGASEAVFSGPVADAIALDATFTSSGRIAILCTDRLIYCRTNGNRTLDQRFEDATLHSYDLSADGATICLSRKGLSERQEILAFDSNGDAIYSKDSFSGVRSIARYKNRLFVDTSGEVLAIDLKKGTEKSVPSPADGIRILAVSEGEILCCTKKKALYIEI